MPLLTKNRKQLFNENTYNNMHRSSHHKVKPSDPQWQMSYLLYPSIFDTLTDNTPNKTGVKHTKLFPPPFDI